MGKKGYKSIYGAPYRGLDYLLRRISKENMKVLVTDDFDGLNSIYIAKKGHNVDCYENDNILLNGGIIDGFETIGIKNRRNEYALDNLIIKEDSLFSNKILKEYDFVFSYKTLNLDKNKKFTRDLMMRKLKSSVKENGYLFIRYIISDKDNDYTNYPKNVYFRHNEMVKFFDESWNIIFIKEHNFKSIDYKHPFNNEDHYHTYGSIFVQKKYKKRIYKYHYNLYTPDDYSDFL